MKITEMLLREDFYQINKCTLAEYYKNCGDKKKLYIYPRLNAIVVKKPSSAVEEYLLTEYDVRGSKLKRMAIRMYTRLCMNTFGMLAKQKMESECSADADTLIYPCNRKYRIFDFAKQTVSVQIKAGFPKNQLEHEIAFRTRSDLPDFVPILVCHTASGYMEQIINGRPLARIENGYDEYKQKAYNQLLQYANQFDERVSAHEYALKLNENAMELSKGTGIDFEEIFQQLSKLLDHTPDITLTFSHGDLQAGNIWVENGTNKVFIIDWESWGMRSSFYDKAALFDGLRPGDINKYLYKQDITLEEKAIVLLEDIIFQLEEFHSLPGEFGLDRFTKYLADIHKWSGRIYT